MASVTETFPGTAITANQKADVQAIPTGADDNWWNATDSNKVLQAIVAMGRAQRANAMLAAITGAAEALTFPKIVKFTGAASGGLPVVTAVLTADADKQSAVGVAILAQGGSTVSAAAATPIFLARECVLTGTWSAGSYYYPDASGDLSTTAITEMDPIGYAISTTLLYFNAQGVKRRQSFMAGDVGIGIAVPPYALAVQGATAEKGSIQVVRIADDAYNAYVRIAKARGVVGTPTAVLANDYLGAVSFEGWNGTQWGLWGAEIIARAVGNWSGSSNGASLDFQTTPSGSTSSVSRMTIADTGEIVATGTMKATGFLVGANQVIGAQGAAVADPAGGGTVDTECRAQLVALLGKLRTHGLIAT